MANHNIQGILVEHKILIRSVIVKSMSVILDIGIRNTLPILQKIDALLDEFIIKEEILSKLSFNFLDSEGDLVSVWEFVIDWAEYNVQVGNGDDYVHLHNFLVKDADDNDINDFTLRSVSEVLYEMRELIRGSAHYLKWKKLHSLCIIVVT